MFPGIRFLEEVAHGFERGWTHGSLMTPRAPNPAAISAGFGPHLTSSGEAET
jgi:hypothetical protein